MMGCGGADAEAIGVAAGDRSDIIGHIHEAAHASQEWPKVVERIADLSGSAGGAVLLLNEQAPTQGWATSALSPFLEWLCAGDRRKVLPVLPGWHSLSEPLLGNLKGLGLGASQYAAIPAGDGDVIVFIFARWAKDGDYPGAQRHFMDELGPHLRRAALLSRRLRLVHAESAVAMLAAMNLPAAALSASGRVIIRNAVFASAVGDEESALLFRLAMAEPGERSVPIAAQGGRPARVLHLLPFAQRVGEFFSGADRLVAVTRVEAGAFAPSPTVLAGLFHLTPGEAAIAASLAAGLTLKEAAAAGGITAKSGRTYLDRIFRKTGTHQQSHLVALLKSAGPLGGRA
jgi:DNA-binding CsgD family transcriptional regulator